jgi:hypothetical protein
VSQVAARRWKPPLAPIAILLFGVGVSACGETGRTTATPPPTAAQAATGRVTVTSASTASIHRPSPEGSSPVSWGHAADGGETREVTELVKRYYVAATADDGAKGCSLIYSILAEAIAEEYGQTPGSPSLRGTTCAVVMYKLFKQQHRRLVADLPRLTVKQVRVEGLRGLVLLRFGPSPDRVISLHREHRAWKIDSMIDSEVR